MTITLFSLLMVAVPAMFFAGIYLGRTTPIDDRGGPGAGGRSNLAQKVLAMCRARDWSLHWTARGAYLHLEASELIEAIRGKHGDPTEEAADVLIVLQSITENAGIPWEAVELAALRKVEAVTLRPRYPAA